MGVVYWLLGTLLGWLPFIIAFVVFKIFIPFHPFICFLILHITFCLQDAVIKTTPAGVLNYKKIPSQRTTFDLKILDGTINLKERFFYCLMIALNEIVSFVPIVCSITFVFIFYWVTKILTLL